MSSVIKLSDKPAVTVAAYHESLYTVFTTGAKAVATMRQKAVALIKSKYAERFPSYSEWENDLAALKAIADRKSVDVQYYWKTYRLCMHEVFGALPVSLDADAKRVRESRMTLELKAAHDKAYDEAKAAGKSADHAAAIAVQAAKKAKTTKQAKPGAPQGEVKDQQTGTAESVEQFIARVGVFAALDAVASILAAEKETESKAKALTSIRNQLARQLKPAEQKAA
jgi:hypothetical protein